MSTPITATSTTDPAPGTEPGLEVDLRNMPYELGPGFGARARIALVVLATDYSIEAEFARILDMPGVAVFHNRIHNDPEITPTTLARMENRIADVVAGILPDGHLDVVAYGCTSASLVIGAQRVHAQIHRARPGVLCTTPMEAAMAAFSALAVRRIALLTPYVNEINHAMRRAMLASGIEIPVMGSFNIADDNAVARLDRASLRRAVLTLAGHPSVDGVFVSCTNVAVAEQVQELEQLIGRPVVSSNLATAWHAVRLAGVEDSRSGFGRLLTVGL